MFYRPSRTACRESTHTPHSALVSKGRRRARRRDRTHWRHSICCPSYANTERLLSVRRATSLPRGGLPILAANCSWRIHSFSFTITFPFGAPRASVLPSPSLETSSRWTRSCHRQFLQKSSKFPVRDLQTFSWSRPNLRTHFMKNTSRGP